MTKKRYIIYALHHPDSARVYVGRSSSGTTRARVHGTPAYLAGEVVPVRSWIKALRARGEDYSIAVLEEFDSPDFLNEAEMFHIAALRCAGVPLLNVTDGGEAPPSSKGRKYSAERNAKIGAALRGRKHSEQSRKNMSEGRRGMVFSETHLQHVREANQRRVGQPRSIGVRTRISEKLLGHSVPVEVREKITAKLAGRSLSSEHRAKLGAGGKRRWLLHRVRNSPIDQTTGIWSD